LKCPRCGSEVRVLDYYPGIAKVTHKLRHGEFICRACLEQAVREEWRKRIERGNRRRGRR